MAAVLVPPWLEVWFPPIARRNAQVAILRGARRAYIGLAVLAPAVGLALMVAAIARRGHRPRPRWLLGAMAATFALLTGFAVAEGVSAVRLAAMRVPFPRLAARFPDPPGDRTIDLLVLGASSARGVPYNDWFSVGEMVAWRLREALPERPVTVTDLSRPGQKIDQLHILLGSLERRPDLVILYSGHNEFSMRHDWAHGVPHYLDEIAPAQVTPEGWIRAHSWVCGVIDQTLDLIRQATPPTRTVARRLVDVPVYTPEEYDERLRDFRLRVEAITAYCESVGATVVLVIPPGNDADFEPNRSVLPASTPREQREAFAREFEAARRLEEEDPQSAAANYRELLQQQPGFAEVHYRLGRLEERAGRSDEADRHYIAARDCDGLPMRCLSDFQEVYREVAGRHPRAILVDGPAVLRAASPRRRAGDESFTDGFHPSLIGYAAIGEAILRAMHARRALGWGTSSPTPSLSPEELARHFGMDSARWRAVCAYGAWFYRHTADVRFDPSNRLAKADRFQRAGEQIAAGKPPEELGQPGLGVRRLAAGPRP